MVQRRTVALERLAECLGLERALVLTAFFSGRPTFYVPEKFHQGHLLGRVVGEDGFLALIRDFGGETVELPQANFQPEIRLGLVYRGMKAGQTTHQIADQIGISWRRVRQIERLIESGQALTAAAKNA
jgi:hypothetical protein